MPLPVIKNTTTREAHTFWDHLLEDENGVIVETENFESEGLLADGDICDVHLCTLNSETKGIMKVARLSVDNDLVENEAEVLQALFPKESPEEEFYRYLPRLLHTSLYEKRRVNVLPYFNEHVSFEAIQAAYPEGISHLDVAWMYKRLLVAIGFAHIRGYVHGAVLPPHFLVHPKNHGGRLLDWCYATKIGSPIRAISTSLRSFYPPEVFKKEAANPTVDIYMAAKCIVHLLGGDVSSNEMPERVPLPIQEFFRRSLASLDSLRPPSAWDLHDEFDELLKKVVGPRTYRVFEMPVAE